MNSDSKSILWAAIVLSLVGILILTYFRAVYKTNSGEITQVASTTEESAKTYEVKKGDSLWKIAAATYNDGYKWNEIYESNKSQISDPNKLEIGMQLILPDLESNTDIKSYTVQKGDNLWKIAEALCGDGYEWSDIARQNNLQNPGIIHAGNVIKFVCK